MTTSIRVFVSSKMQELAAERQALQELLPTLGSELVNLRAWVFEQDAPATDKSIRNVYLDALKESALYIGLFWNEYGEWTIDEFERATEWSIDRHIYVKDVDRERRDPRLSAFLGDQSDVVIGITPKWFTSIDDLKNQVRKSIDIWLRDRLVQHPGDTSAILAVNSDDIPDLPARLLGRDSLLERISSQLQQGGKVLLQGFGGMGKTALTATVAANWIDDGQGDVLWLRAGSENAFILAEALARPFDAHQIIAHAAEREKMRALHTVLADSSVSLLVLDNVWNGSALSQILKAVSRRLPVLVTARQRYALEHIIEVGKLLPDDALALLNYYAGQEQIGEASHEICHQLGYHAFALEVAGKTLKVDQISAAELLNRIASAPHAMAMPEDFAEEGRTSITELLTASLVALEADVQRVFLAFGQLFAPQGTPDLLSRLLEQDVTQVEAACTTLARRGLAEREAENHSIAAVYRVHDLAHSYARAMASLHSDDQSGVVAASRTYAVDHATNVKELVAVQSNLLGAAEAAKQSGDHESLIAIMEALCGAYLSTRGHTLLFLELLDAAITSAQELGHGYRETLSLLLGKQGNIYFDRGALSESLATYQEALAVARAINLRERLPILLCTVGKVLSAQGHTAQAEAHFEEALQIAHELHDKFLVGFVLEHQGYHAQFTGNYQAARDYFGQEIEIAETIGDSLTQFYALLNYGSAELELKNYASALEYHGRALSIAENLNNPILVALAIQNRGEDYVELGNRDEATALFNQALTIFRESGMQSKAREVEDLLNNLAH